ncbi:hypothetical protein ABN273_28720 [Nonomuraea sp. B19D2]
MPMLKQAKIDGITESVIFRAARQLPGALKNNGLNRRIRDFVT